jgi:hypothetical protein
MSVWMLVGIEYCGELHERLRANWKAPMCCVGDLKRATIAAVFAAALGVSASAQEFMADAGAPASAFPNPNRPVADIVSPIWHSEKERDAASEPRQLVRLLGIKTGMTIADIGGISVGAPIISSSSAAMAAPPCLVRHRRLRSGSHRLVGHDRRHLRRRRQRILRRTAVPDRRPLRSCYRRRCCARIFAGAA